MKKNKTKVISLISAKGGSGKTILTATLGKVLSELGKRVLIVDADAATNGLSLFYLTQILSHYEDNDKNLRGLFDAKFFTHKRVTVPLNKNLFLLPATFQFKNTMEVGHDDFSLRISKLLEFNAKEENFDFILIDNQAGSEYYTEHVIKREISDEIIIVSEYDPISAAGIERLKGFFNQDLTYDRTWVVLNKVLPEFGDASNSFLEISKYLPPQIWNAEVVKSYAKKEIPIDFKHGNIFTLSIIRLIKTLLGKSINEDINNWIKGKEEMV